MPYIEWSLPQPSSGFTSDDLYFMITGFSFGDSGEDDDGGSGSSGGTYAFYKRFPAFFIDLGDFILDLFDGKLKRKIS